MPVRIGFNAKFRLLFVGALLLLLSACRTEATVRIDVDSDGAGRVAVEVALDAEAAESIVDLRSTGLPLTDLTEAGWSIDQPPVVGEDGMTRVAISKPFGTPEQLAEVMAELDGGAGVFSNFALERETSFAKVNYLVSGTVNPQSFEVFADSELASVLNRSIESLAKHYGASVNDVSILVEVRLPGEPNSEAELFGESIDSDGGTARSWSTSLGAAEPETVSLSTETTQVAALVWRGVAIVAGSLAALVAFGHLLRIVRPERRRRGKSSKPKSGTASARKTAAELDDLAELDEQPGADASISDDLDTSEGGESQVEPRMIALDGMGVLYKEGDDINKLLVPFIREMGSLVSNDVILAKSRLLSLGRITPSDFWIAVGLKTDPTELDTAYLSLHQLTPGVVAFLRSMRDRGVRVAVITNDCSRWANHLRTRHSLEGLIDPWVVSGAVGVRKPEQPPYEALRRMSGLTSKEILVVDDDLDNLDAAKEFGFSTAWYSAEGGLAESRGHQILRSFRVPEPAE